jgi:hypothetical protein
MRKEKAIAQKNALLKNAQANAKGNFFKRVFFSPAQEETQIIFFPPFGSLIIYSSNTQCLTGPESSP